MKKTITAIAILISFIACEKATEKNEMKTAYIDTATLMQESTEAKDIKAKYEEKAKVMGTQLEAEVARWKSEAASFQKNAQANGQAWAQQKGAELQKREQQLSYAQEGMLRQLQQENGVEMDTLVSQYKKVIKDFGKEKGYDYVYGTGEANSILYAKDKYEITKEVVKLVNDKYKTADKKDEKDEAKADEKKK
jgi:outer membrane protein